MQPGSFLGSAAETKALQSTAVPPATGFHVFVDAVYLNRISARSESFVDAAARYGITRHSDRRTDTGRCAEGLVHRSVVGERVEEFEARDRTFRRASVRRTG